MSASTLCRLVESFRKGGRTVYTFESEHSFCVRVSSPESSLFASFSLYRITTSPTMPSSIRVASKDGSSYIGVVTKRGGKTVTVHSGATEWYLPLAAYQSLRPGADCWISVRRVDSPSLGAPKLSQGARGLG